MEHTNKKGKALPLCTGTMEARNLKVTTIDRRLHAGTEGFRNPHPFSPHAGKGLKDFPY